jgi:hypothetical protein
VGGVFINYRGEDTDTAAALIDQELAARFGSDRVFLDCRSIPAGTDFAEELLGRLRACSVLLVVIGPRWLTLRDATGQRRIDDSRDWIRREIVEALTGGLRVIPVLTGNVMMPAAADLPQDVAGLSRRQYVPLRRRYTSVDLAFLVERITEADSELAEVAARRLPSAERVPQQPAAVVHSADTEPKRTRRGRSVTGARRLRLILLPIAASLLVTFLVAFKTYRSDLTPDTSASAQEPTPAITITPTERRADPPAVAPTETGSSPPKTVTPQPGRVEKALNLPIDYGIDLDSEVPNWSMGPKIQSPFFLEASRFSSRFGAAYGTEIAKIDDNATIDECWNATGFGPSIEFGPGGAMFPENNRMDTTSLGNPMMDTITVCAHTRGGHYAIVHATFNGFYAVLDITVWVSTT